MQDSSNNKFNLQNEFEETKSMTMDLEVLQQQYSNLLISYQQAVSDYVSYLNQQSQLSQPNYNINKQPYVSIQGYAYNGTGGAGATQASNLQECIAACSNSENCSGATFVSGRCLLRTGESPIVPSTQTSYAIVPESMKLLFNMENINQQLIQVNQQLTDKMKTANPLYDSQVSSRFQQQQLLIQNYEELIRERDNILSLIKEYETLDNTSSNDEIKINSNYYVYILLLILVIACTYLLYKLATNSSNTTSPATIQYGSDLGTNIYLIAIGIILVILFINYSKQ